MLLLFFVIVIVIEVAVAAAVVVVVVVVVVVMSCKCLFLDIICSKNNNSLYDCFWVVKMQVICPDILAQAEARNRFHRAKKEYA